jgi:hypothetical protein
MARHHDIRIHTRASRNFLISDALPFGRLWYLDAAAAVGC